MKRIQSILAGAAVLTLANVESAGALAGGSYGAANFLLELEGANAGAISSFSGGAIGGEVVEANLGTSNIQKKHLATVNYEPVSFEAGLSMDKSLLNWISDAVDGVAARKNGAVVIADHNFAVRSRIGFENALITEVTIPAMNAAVRQQGNLNVVVQPEAVKNSAPGGSVKAGTLGKKQKPWLTSNFRLAIPGLNCSKVKKIESITIKQSFEESEAGETRFATKVPGRVEYPNLRITIPAAFGGDFLKWHEDFVVKGNNSDDKEREGELGLLSSDLSEELARVKFYNLGISRLEQKSSNGEGLDYVIDLYVERMEIDFMAQFEK